MNKYIILLFSLIVFHFTHAQTVSTYAGTGSAGIQNGTKETATFNQIRGIAIDAAGNMYVSDQFSCIRKITAAGVVSTLAGNGTLGSTDGPGHLASFNMPNGLAVDAAGNVYVADSKNNKIRKITPAGVVSTFAGTGDYWSTGTDGPGAIATFSAPSDITIDAAGNLFVVDKNNRKIRKITPAGVVSTFAGNFAQYALVDGTGTAASFLSPTGITIDPSGNLYVTEIDQNKIRKITPAGIVTTYAGSGDAGAADGYALSATFRNPYHVAADASGNIYVSDITNHKIRKIAANGTVSTVAGNGTAGNTDGSIVSATFNGPCQIVIDAAGNIYIADSGNNKIRKIAFTTSQSISGLTDINKVSTDVPFTLTATASSGLPVTYSSSNPAVATISGNTVTITGTGNAIITASQAGNSTYTPETRSVTLSVIKAGQSISGLADVYKNSKDVSFNLSAVASSGLPVTYSSSNAAVATIVGNTVRINGTGTTTITATQGGNWQYDPATAVTSTLTVTPVIQNIPGFGDMYASLGDPSIILSQYSSAGDYVTYSSSNTSIALTSGDVIILTGAGTATITGTIVVTGQKFTAQITISKQAQTITGLTNMNKVATGADFALPAGTSVGYTLTYSSSNPSVATIVSGNYIKLNGAGTTTITATHAGTARYAPISQSVTLTVSKATQTITSWTDVTKVTTDNPFQLYLYTSSGLPLTYTSSNPAVAKISGNTVTIVSAGESTISASQSGTEKYEAAATVSFTLSVTKVAQTLHRLTDISKSSTDAPFTLDAYSSSGLPVTYSSSDPKVATVSGNTVTITGTGTATIIASQDGNATYQAANSIGATLTVSFAKSNQSITGLSDINKSVSDAPFNLSATASSGLQVTYTSSNPAVATVSGNKVTIVAPGITQITASQAGNAAYNAATPVTVPFTVSKAIQTISGLSDINKTVTDDIFNLTAKSSSGLEVTYTSSNYNVASITGNKVTIYGVGITTITAYQHGNATYSGATAVTATLTVGKASQSITGLSNINKLTTDAPFNVNATASSGLAVTYISSKPEVATVSGNKVTIVGPGTTNITASQTGNTAYNAATPVTVVLTVSKVAQTISGLSNMTKLVTDEPFNLNAAASSGLPLTYTSSNPLIATVSGNQVTIVGPGTTTIIASQTGNTTYMPAAALTVTLTVSKVTQTISGLSNISKQPGDAPFNLSATASSGLAVTYISSNPLVATISGNKVTIMGTGTTTITASQTGNTTYNAAPVVTATLTVSKLTQTISGLSDINKLITDAAFNLNATASSELAVTYTSSNPAVATISGNKVTITGKGKTTITASQPGNTIYNAAPAVKVTLTVGGQTISGLSDLTKSVADGSFTLDATTSSGLPVTYTSSNPSVATVSGNTITIVGPGTTVITASQGGNSSYIPADDVSVTLTVQLTTDIEISAVPGTYKVYDGGNFTIIVEGDADIINIVNLAGQSIYTGSSKQINVGSTGLFVVRVQHKNQLLVKKVVVK